MTADARGPWSWEEAEEFLRESVIPVRLACVTPSGFPLVVSVWYLYEHGAIWCATHEDSALARHLARDPRCGFEVAGDAPPYRGVRGRARAELRREDAGELLERLIQRYLGSKRSRLAHWLLGRAAEEYALRLEPARVVTWDYTERMAEDIEGDR